MKSLCHAENGTAPKVAASIKRAVLASGNRMPEAYRWIEACVLSTLVANDACVFAGSLNHADRAV